MSEPTEPTAEHEARIQRLLHDFEQQLRQSLPQGPQTLEQIEDQVEEIGQAIKERIQKEVLDQQSTGDGGAQTRCACGKQARRRGYYPRTLVTRHGAVRRLRAYYHCVSCRRGFCPLDGQLGIGAGQCSASVVALLTRFATYLSFRQAAKELELICGIRLSPSTVQHYAQAVGQQISSEWADKQARLEQEEPVFSGRPAGRMQVTLDGVLIFAGQGWREVKLGCVYQPGMGNARYCASLSDSLAFGRRLRTLGAYAGVEECGQVAVVADGAEWIWQEVSKYYPRRVQILDYFHASQHLWQVAHAWQGEGSAAAAEWVALQQQHLHQDQVSAVLEAIAGWQPTTMTSEELKRRALGYFGSHASRLRYGTFSQLGFDIGSGVAESGCKSVVQARLKGAGMRWSEKGAEAMLQLRGAWCSDQAVDFRKLARRALVPA